MSSFLFFVNTAMRGKTIVYNRMVLLNLRFCNTIRILMPRCSP